MVFCLRSRSHPHTRAYSFIHVSSARAYEAVCTTVGYSNRVCPKQSQHADRTARCSRQHHTTFTTAATARSTASPCFVCHFFFTCNQFFSCQLISSLATWHFFCSSSRVPAKKLGGSPRTAPCTRHVKFGFHNEAWAESAGHLVLNTDAATAKTQAQHSHNTTNSPLNIRSHGHRDSPPRPSVI